MATKLTITEAKNLLNLLSVSLRSAVLTKAQESVLGEDNPVRPTPETIKAAEKVIEKAKKSEEVSNELLRMCDTAAKRMIEFMYL